MERKPTYIKMSALVLFITVGLQTALVLFCKDMGQSAFCSWALVTRVSIPLFYKYLLSTYYIHSTGDTT